MSYAASSLRLVASGAPRCSSASPAALWVGFVITGFLV